MAVMKASQFVDIAKDIATNYKTLYVYGCFGAPLNATNKKRYTNNYDYNKRADRKAKILAASDDSFGFDCVCLIKGILWGWKGDKNKTYGGAVYGSNGVPDTNANGMFNNYCYDKSSNFSNVKPGELVWMDGHIGIAITNKLAVECTPIWKDGVQITAMNCSVPGYKTRNWSSHGKCKFIEYDVTPGPTPFLPPRGYYKIGDSDEHVEIIDNFLAAKTEGNYFGTYTKFAVIAFQRIHNLEQDGNIGPITLRTMQNEGLSRYINLPSRGYYKVGDTGNNIATIDSFLAALIRGNYYGTYTSFAVKALQTIGKEDGIYKDAIDGNFGPLTLKTAEHYGFKY